MLFGILIFQIWAAYEGHESSVRLQLEKGADMNVKDNAGQTLLI